LTLALIEAASKKSSGSSFFLIFIVLLFVAMWIFMIRPQRRKQQAQRDALRNVDVGTEIVTTGGLIGVVTAVADDELTLEIAPGTHVRCARRAVAGILTPEAEEDEVLEDAYDEGDEVDDAPEVAAEPGPTDRTSRR
jgi:preprotein translocase subunit YajC